MYKKSDYVEVNVGKALYLNRIALDCFLGRMLETWEESDHGNRDLTDNSKRNLTARARLFNASNKGLNFNNRTGVTGVFFCEKKNHYVASIRVYTPDGPTISKGKKFNFSVKTHGKKGAFDMAIAFRNRYHLRSVYE
jgi:hypothetical protein